jgi:L-alanine-DL-glutamate epimerase-like enolase superfamily enzyme
VRIEHIETQAVRMPLKIVYKTAIGDLVAENVVVRITTDDGLAGFGEGSTLPSFMETVASAKDAIDRYLGPALIGDDPFAIGAIHAKMDTILFGCSVAKTAIDIALYDIIGKATGQPVYKLLGGPYRTKLRMSRSIGKHVVSEELDELTTLLAAGFTSF